MTAASRDDTPRSNGAILIIEDDATFASILGDLARAEGFEPRVALRGDIGLQLARQFRPDAIVLDLRMPGLDGWVLLDRLKHDESTCDIPVFVVSGLDRRERALRLGAFEFLVKPVTDDQLRAVLRSLAGFRSRARKRVLLVDADATRRSLFADALMGADVEIVSLATGPDAIAACDSGAVDLVVLAPPVANVSAEALVAHLGARDPARATPIVVVAPRGTAGDKLRDRLQRTTSSAIVKLIETPRHAFEESALFACRRMEGLDDRQRTQLRQLRTHGSELEGRTVLVVDDDSRNVYALKALLDDTGVRIVTAENGQQALDVIAREPQIDVVLMDIMMPVMDGHEATRAIRTQPAHRSLPIIALTARTSPGDRERCIDAGATDYIAKPIDADQLFAVLRLSLTP